MVSRSDAPIFLLSLPRSGSTLLRYLFDTHPEVASPPELELGTLAASLYHTIDSSLGHTVEATERRLFVHAEVERLLSSLLARYATARGKQRWCEKSPHDNLEHLELISALYPEAHYVCLFRHVMDFIFSVLEANRYRWWPFLHPFLAAHQQAPVEAVAAYWLTYSRKLLDFERNGAWRAHHLRYEDLVAKPAETLARLLEHCALSPAPKLLDEAFRITHDEGGGDTKIRFTQRIEPGSVGKGRAVPISLLSPPLRREIDHLLPELGYQELGDNFNERGAELEPPVATPRPESFETSQLAGAFEQRLRQKLAARPEAFTRLKASFRIAIEGVPEADWGLDLRSGAGELRRGSTGNEDCAIVLAQAILSGILAGTLNPQEAFLRGDIRVRGDEELAAALGSLL